MAADGSTVIKVYYTRTTYKITFTYGDKVGESVEYTLRYGQQISYNPSFSVQGYVFDGWDREIPATMPAEDITLNATWTAGQGVTYTVEHYVQNANDDEYALDHVETRTGTTGATVNGEYLATMVGQGLKLNYGESREIEADGSTVIKIYYDRENYTVTYTYGDKDGESVVESVRFGATLPEAPEFVLVGYTFAGWDAEIADTMPASDLVYVALWTPNEDTAFTVEHYYQNANDDEYTLVDSMTEYGVTDSMVNGADYKQEFEQAVFEKADRLTIAADGSTVVKVYYSRSTYTLTFKYDFDSDEQETFTLRFGQTFPESPTFEKAGYTFMGWIGEDGCFVDQLVGEMPAYDVTYTSDWMPNEDTPFEVEHYIEQADGSGYDLAGSSTETGRTNDWVDIFSFAYENNEQFEFERVSSEEFVILPDGSGVLKIFYRRVRYTVTFLAVDQNGNPIEGVDPMTYDFKYDQTITPPEMTPVDGYEFAGYESPYETMPAEGIEFLIVWNCIHESGDGDHQCDRCWDPLDCEDHDGDGHCDYGREPMDPDDHRYVDGNGDHICDVCCGSFSDLCYDDDNNGKCDVCDTDMLCPVTGDYHSDDDEDHFCDGCDLWMSYLCEAWLTDERHECEICHTRFYEKCTDEDGDCWCDGCNDRIPCVDEDGDSICDRCGNCAPHIDVNQNSLCDVCGAPTWCEEADDMHRDNNYDHTCDVCGIRMGDFCFDGNDDGRCDECYRPFYCQDYEIDHADGDEDHYCDECGVWLSYLCVDGDGDWTCDSCGNELTCIDHVDEDGNALCDICREETKCKENPYDSFHADDDWDHTCDCCGVWLSSYCWDDGSGNCGECGREFSCVHMDEDEDNYCDFCYKIINCSHDSVWDHYCEECGEQVSDCCDEDNNLWCDECGGYVECRHMDMEGRHICDYCYEFLTECIDEDGDGMCDFSSESFPH